jgi:hypothetical protein
VELLALSGYGSFVLVSLVVGMRLLRLWLRTHETPELAIAVTLIAGGLSYALAIAAFSMTTLPQLVAVLLETLAAFFSHLASASLALALRHIFRPEARWARALQMALTVAVVLAFATRLVEPLAFPPPGFVFWPYALTGACVYAWSTVESLHHHRLLARRARLGLAAPEMARRLLLWAVAGAAALGIYVTTMVERVLHPGFIPPWSIALGSALGVVAAVGISFAFFPSRRRAAPAPLEAGAGG